MKKLLPIIVIAIIAIAAVGYVMVKGKSQQAATTDNSGVPTANTGSNIFTSIKDAMSKSITLKCTYKDPDGNSGTAYIKGNAVRADGIAMEKGKTGSMIFKDNKFWSWDDKSKEGVMMDLTPPTQTPEEKKAAKTNPPPKSGEEEKNQVLDDLEKQKENCKPEVVSDSMFTPPSSVKFTDFAAMMKGAAEDNPAAKKELEEQMKKYQDQNPPDSSENSGDTGN